MNQELKANDLSLKLNLAGYGNNYQSVNNNKEPIAEGTLQFTKNHSGIQVHTCDLIEQREMSSSAELEPCLSINILLNGKVKYQLGKCIYEFEATNNQPIVIVNAISETEIFTRFMSPNQRVKKLNISCDKQWFFSRAYTPSDNDKLHKIFNKQKQIFSWKASKEAIKIAHEFIQNVTDNSLDKQLLAELNSIRLIQLTLNDLSLISNNHKPDHKINTTFSQPVTSNNTIVNNTSLNNQTLLHKVNKLLATHNSLQEIADALAMSVSTLQRKFKKQHNITVIEHFRKTKLNQSRVHLVIDGLSIGETAYLAGYKHTPNFNYAFKQQFQLTPSEFIKQHKN